MVQRRLDVNAALSQLRRFERSPVMKDHRSGMDHWGFSTEANVSRAKTPKDAVKKQRLRELL